MDMFNVTLQLPLLDFLALVTLATDDSPWSVRGCMDGATLDHAALLDSNVQARGARFAAALAVSSRLSVLLRNRACHLARRRRCPCAIAQALVLANVTWELLHLQRYTGWGGSGQWVQARPQAPVPGDVVRRCGPLDSTAALVAGPPPPPGARGGEVGGGGGGGGGGEEAGGGGVPVGVVVGCTVGGAAALAAAAGVAVLLVRRRRRRRQKGVQYAAG